MNPNGVVHGAVLFALADTGMGSALVPTLAPGESCATIEIKINYFKPVREGALSCETMLVNRGKSIANLESRVLHEGKLSLDRRYCWVDAWAFEAAAQRAEAAAEPAALEALAERMLALYRGPFMAGDVDEPWYEPPRDRMRARLARAMGRVLRHWQESGQRERALACDQACREADPGFNSLVTDR